MKSKVEWKSNENRQSKIWKIKKKFWGGFDDRIGSLMFQMIFDRWKGKATQ